MQLVFANLLWHSTNIVTTKIYPGPNQSLGGSTTSLSRHTNLKQPTGKTPLSRSRCPSRSRLPVPLAGQTQIMSAAPAPAGLSFCYGLLTRGFCRSPTFGWLAYRDTLMPLSDSNRFLRTPYQKYHLCDRKRTVIDERAPGSSPIRDADGYITGPGTGANGCHIPHVLPLVFQDGRSKSAEMSNLCKLSPCVRVRKFSTQCEFNATRLTLSASPKETGDAWTRNRLVRPVFVHNL